jgi:hypothetical protein
MEDFDLPFAYEALARAHGVAGNTDDAKRFRELARESADRIADAEDKEVVLGDLATL